MRYIPAGHQPDARTWSFPEIEGALEGLGYESIGLVTVDEHPDLEDVARGDMADADLAFFNDQGRWKDVVFWHPDHRVFAQISGWLDEQPVLTFRTDFEDSAILRTQSRFHRMPTWRTKVEDVDDYQNDGHAPAQGSFVQVSTDPPEAQHAQHLAEHERIARQRRTQARRSGSLAAYIEGTNRRLDWVLRNKIAALAQRLLLQVVGAVVAVAGLAVMATWATLPGLGMGMAGALLWFVANNRPHWVPRLYAPAVPEIGSETPFLDD